MCLIHGKVKQHIDGSMQNDTAVFSNITEIGHPCIKPLIFVLWMNDIMILMQCPLFVRGVNLACHREVHFASVFAQTPRASDLHNARADILTPFNKTSDLSSFVGDGHAGHESYNYNDNTLPVN